MSLIASRDFLEEFKGGLIQHFTPDIVETAQLVYVSFSKLESGAIIEEEAVRNFVLSGALQVEY